MRYGQGFDNVRRCGVDDEGYFQHPVEGVDEERSRVVEIHSPLRFQRIGQGGVEQVGQVGHGELHQVGEPFGREFWDVLHPAEPLVEEAQEGVLERGLVQYGVELDFGDPFSGVAPGAQAVHQVGERFGQAEDGPGVFHDLNLGCGVHFVERAELCLHGFEARFQHINFGEGFGKGVDALFGHQVLMHGVAGLLDGVVGGDPVVELDEAGFDLQEFLGTFLQEEFHAQLHDFFLAQAAVLGAVLAYCVFSQAGHADLVADVFRVESAADDGVEHDEGKRLAAGQAVVPEFPCRFDGRGKRSPAVFQFFKSKWDFHFRRKGAFPGVECLAEVVEVAGPGAEQLVDRRIGEPGIARKVARQLEAGGFPLFGGEFFGEKFIVGIDLAESEDIAGVEVAAEHGGQQVEAEARGGVAAHDHAQVVSGFQQQH